MRKVKAEDIKNRVCEAVIEANIKLPPDIRKALEKAREEEEGTARKILEILLTNADMALKERMPLCQDTGMVVVEVKLGQEVEITGGSLKEAINEGIREGYRKGYFRASVVNDPILRKNTGDNTPGIIHMEMVPGENIEIIVLPKGAGSENMGRVAMLKPLKGVEGIKEFVLQAVKEAGSNPCPPLIVGVGVGGNMEKAAYLAKKALMRPVDIRNEREDIKRLEEELLYAINALNIGPQGLGGKTTALAVNIETYPTHIASLPVAVNLGCHATRRAGFVI
ncbi:fumarate hydratase subunit alpha [Thermosyntropha lipolytica DSM 11003]|uniref:Fumarate hydratase subunit alpha n=1 Tax=Thermosyntropha lipolytica DSM 11003 TaxID=1123382 RepID=A0A1M5MT85_9FIRM|nr:fumarate hydratase [Thermosyntropha lipolytica]SHG80342.1 fumarate hydratase subunit alpha [Thermosyntropha lipolytica DSM 11003]